MTLLLKLALNWRVWAALALAGVLAFSHLTAYRHGRAAIQAKWDAANVVSERAAQEQAARNRELQRQAELHYTVQAATREKFFVTTVREVHDAAAPLAACAVPDSVRVRVNDAIACAVSDSAATCGTDGEVPAAAAPAGRGSSK